MFRHQTATRSPDSLLVVDLGRGDCPDQTDPSNIRAGSLQTILLPTHPGEQIDGSAALSFCADDMLVRRSHRHRGVAGVATFAAIQEGHFIRTRKIEYRYSFITLRERPVLKKTAATWFHSKWSAPEKAYLACMDQYLSHQTELGWYLCMDGDRIVGGLGVIENDFHDRKDLTPNICAVYTEEAYRGQGIAGRLLHQAVEDLRAKGISPVYLLTDHTGFYERYGWEFLCMAQGDSESYLSRMYVHY